MSRLLLLFVLISCAVIGHEQKQDTIFEFSKGKRFLLHTAVDGNTLWGLHSVYKVSVDELVVANPGIEKGVKEGIVYKVPFGATDVKVNDGTKLIQHYVGKGETQFGLCKKYGIKEEQFLNINPNVGGALKIGQKIYLPYVLSNDEAPNNSNGNAQTNTTAQTNNGTSNKPLPKISFTDSIIHYTVKDKETIYTIAKRYMISVDEIKQLNKLKSNSIKAGDVLKIPRRFETVTEVSTRPIPQIIPFDPIEKEKDFEKKEKYKIAVLLPLDLDSKGLNAMKNIAAEFYMGAQAAADSLEAKGFKAQIDIIDFPTDSMKVLAYLKRTEMKSYDLIVGPLVPSSVDIVAKWAKTNKIRVLCPAAVSNSVLKQNPMIFSTVSSEQQQMKQLARHLIKNTTNANFILVSSGIEKEKELYNLFREEFKKIAGTNGPNLIEAKASDFSTFIKKNANTVLIYLTKDKSAAIKFTTAAQKTTTKMGTGSVRIVGTKEWAGFDELTGYVKNRFMITWVVSNNLDYKNERVQIFSKNIRAKYKTDLTKTTAHGYDVLMYGCLEILDKKSFSYLVNDFSCKEVEEGSGSMNQTAYIMSHEKYELIQIAKYND